jgi:hypothetical protein
VLRRSIETATQSGHAVARGSLRPTYAGQGGKMRTMLLTLVILFCGCAAKPLAPGAETVFVSNDKPSAECEFLGEVDGSQGNYLTAELTTHNAAAMGARGVTN